MTLGHARSSEQQDTDPVLDLVDDIVAKARTLDDRHGYLGAAFVGERFTVVARLLRGRTRHGAAADRRWFAALAQLAQTAGFMAHEQPREGIARRWYLSGSRTARTAGDATLAASIPALMSNQATVGAKHSEALQLSWLARQEALQAPAHTACGDLDQAVRATRATVNLSPAIASVHCVDLLRRLRTALDAHRHRATDVRNVLLALERAIPA
ncbi:hypothetical protein ACFZBU_39270 [Embleya sp. NPDC008237]|uniref:hypothetical protein n=1 Tax=Embleya sp. NPDC008237 TaxID=3363978 RepID=UPI0036EEE616